MTQQVRNSYRHHRKATWALALAVAAAIATVVIPFATGARPATYTFTGNASVCAGTTQVTFLVALTNSSKTTQNLGSADLYAPANLTVTDASITSGGGGAASLTVIEEGQLNDEPRSIIHARDLQLPGGLTPNPASVLIEVTADVDDQTVQRKYWYSLAKQANDFNPGDLDTSNAFTNSLGDPYFEVSACELAFTTQPQSPWQKGTTASSAVAVGVYDTSHNLVPSSGLNPFLSATGAGAIGNFDGAGTATYNTTSMTWSWGSLSPKTTAPSGLYNLVASATGFSDATSESFRVTDLICLPTGPPCETTSGIGGPQAQLGITNLPSTTTIDFVSGNASPPCFPWNRAYYTDSSGDHYFPGVVLNFTWGAGMLKVAYRVRNSEWVQTNVARGNNDIEFCAGARHSVFLQRNGDPATNSSADPFTTKYGDDARWLCEDGTAACSESQKLFWGVLATVPNPNKVRDDPAVCARGTQDFPTGLDGASETWRVWTICIPSDWDWKNFG